MDVNIKIDVIDAIIKYLDSIISFEPTDISHRYVSYDIDGLRITLQFKEELKDLADLNSGLIEMIKISEIKRK